MDHSLTRGAAAAFAFGAIVAAAPLQAQVVAAGASAPRQVQRDSFFVRVIDAGIKAKIDSMMVMMRLLENEPATSEEGLRLRKKVEVLYHALSPARGGFGGGTMILRGGEEFGQARLKGWIGINPGLVPFDRYIDSTGDFIHYYRYPEIVSVEPDSPAQRAGIAPGDVLVAYDGQDVVKGRVNIGQLLVPERKLAVTVRRDGEMKDYPMVVVKTPERIASRRAEPGEWSMEERAKNIARSFGDPPRRPMPAVGGSVSIEIVPGSGVVAVAPSRFMLVERNGIFGAAIMSVGAELAKALNVDQGVLVQQCPPPTPAYKAGLRTGDVIVSVSGQSVLTASDIQKVVQARASDRAVAFQVVREKKPVTINVKW